MVTGSTFQDPVHSRPSQPLDNPSISFDAGLQLGPRRSNKSSMRSERTSLQSTSTDDTLSVSTRGNNPSHSFGSTQASDHHLRPKDSLSDPSHSLRTPYKASPLPHGPHKVLREHRLTTPDPEPYVIPKPSDTCQDNLDKEYTSLATKYIPRALKITETDNTPDRTLSEPKDTQRASSAATTELERLEMTLSSYLHSRNNQHESSTCPQTAASTLSRPGNTAKSSTTPKSQYKVEYKEPPTVYNKAQALLLNPKDYSFSDSSEIVKYLPYAPDTAIDLYNIRMPTPEETRYPSQSCEVWALHIFKLLDQVTTFRPTYYITDKLVPVQEIGFWPEYGELHIAYIQLIHQSLTRRSERDSLGPIPEWPASDHLFHAEAFEVAAVSFRDQMEQSIQKLYDIITKSTNQSSYPTCVTGQFSHDHPMPENLCNRTMQLSPDRSLTASATFKASTPPLLRSSEESLSKFGEFSSNSNDLSLPAVSTEEIVEYTTHTSNKWPGTNNLPLCTSSTEPKRTIRHTGSSMQLGAIAAQAHTSTSMRPKNSSAHELPSVRVSNESSDSSLDIPGPFQVLTAPIEPLLQESSRQSSKSSPH
ncbi:hypothetical protein RSAG8_13373, partial [Rhizoctonia solani AG-8 WAC10335]